MLGRIFILLLVAIESCSAQGGEFLNGCFANSGKCLPLAGCVIRPQVGCNRNMGCCMNLPSEVGATCALSETEFGTCADVCGSGNQQNSCATGICCENIIDDTTITSPETTTTPATTTTPETTTTPATTTTPGTTMAPLPGLNEDCGTSTESGICIDATECTDALAGGSGSTGPIKRAAHFVRRDVDVMEGDAGVGNLCQDELVCCKTTTEAFLTNLGKSCGYGGSCQRECCESAADATGDCGETALLCCVPGLGMNCKLPGRPLVEAICVPKDECDRCEKEKGRGRHGNRRRHGHHGHSGGNGKSCKNDALACCETPEEEEVEAKL